MTVAVAAEAVPTGAPVRYSYEDTPGNIVEEVGRFLSEVLSSDEDVEDFAKVLTPRDKIRVVPLSDLIVEKLS